MTKVSLEEQLKAIYTQACLQHKKKAEWDKFIAVIFID